MLRTSDPQKHYKSRWFLTFLHLLHDRSWDRFRTNSGSILDPKIRLHRPQEGAKIDQKNDREVCWIWDRFLTIFGPILSIFDFFDVFGGFGGQGAFQKRRLFPGAEQRPFFLVYFLTLLFLVSNYSDGTVSETIDFRKKAALKTTKNPKLPPKNYKKCQL